MTNLEYLFFHFAVLGYDTPAEIEITSATIDPSVVRIGNSVRVMCTVSNTSSAEANLLLDLAVHFVKANGSVSAKVFKLTTRAHHPGEHRIELLVNNVPHTRGSFTLVADTDGDPTSRDR